MNPFDIKTGRKSEFNLQLFVISIEFSAKCKIRRTIFKNA